jgi:hypothetical protein
MMDKLPVRADGSSVFAQNIKYFGDNIGFVLIYPNPSNQEKYVAVFSGNTARTIDCFEKIWPRFMSGPKDIDIGIFEIDSEEDSVSWRLKGVFGSDWNWKD